MAGVWFGQQAANNHRSPGRLAKQGVELMTVNAAPISRAYHRCI
jgi:hypothetical protein